MGLAFNSAIKAPDAGCQFFSPDLLVTRSISAQICSTLQRFAAPATDSICDFQGLFVGR
jgi:hypothetical protein